MANEKRAVEQLLSNTHTMLKLLKEWEHWGKSLSRADYNQLAAWRDDIQDALGNVHTWLQYGYENIMDQEAFESEADEED